MYRPLLQVLSEREELQRSLSELQAQRKDVLGQSREMGAKYDTIQEEVHKHTYTHTHTDKWRYTDTHTHTDKWRCTDTHTHTDKWRYTDTHW